MTTNHPPAPARRAFSLRGILLALCAAGAFFGPSAAAQIVTGTDWIVAYSLPSQTLDAALPGEFTIRDLLVGSIDRLRQNDDAELATFTFSGEALDTGCAGPMLLSISNALSRGASIHFVADGKVDRLKPFLPGLSLKALSRLEENPMVLSVSPRSTMMHHKAAIFDYGAGEQWTFVGSGNFTRASNRRQWNVATLIRNPDLFAAFAAEMAEFRAGRFGERKQRGHDRTTFRLDGAWGDCWVRFGPYPSLSGTPRSAETEIRRLIDSAEHDVFFAMHHFSRAPIRRALVAAANRGVNVAGVIPESDRGKPPFAVSGPTVAYFADPANYVGTNRVRLLPIRASAIGTSWDSGEPDLAHLKYMVVDPGGEHPVVVHGAANWTAAGIDAKKGNDENILFLRHAGIARAFMEQFRRMTGTTDEAAACP